MKPKPAVVAVIGSLNLDYIASVQTLPVPGQTIAAAGLARLFGGKGANQAVAAARHGATVHMIGCVGQDEAGALYLARLKSEGLDISGIGTARNELTGTALIAVDGKGENLIIVAAGANGALKPAHIRANRKLIESSNAVLMQLEVPEAAVLEAMAIANRAGVPVVLNPSPIREGFPFGKHAIDTLITNEGEAEAIFGLAPGDIESNLAQWRKGLIQRRIDCLVITRGAQPTLCLTAAEFLPVPGLRVKPVDTVGAGDTFAGTYTTRRAEGAALAVAIRLANSAGALATLKPGAQESIPSRRQAERAAAQFTCKKSVPKVKLIGR